MTPSREDFDRWREDQVTRWVLSALEGRAEHQRLHWLGVSWENGHANPTVLLELRARASAWIEMVNGDYDYWCGALGEEPVD